MKQLEAILLARPRVRVWFTVDRSLLFIILLGCLLRMAPSLWLEWQDPGWHAAHINEIEFYYDDVARSLIAGKGFVHSVNSRSANSEYKFYPGTPFHFVPPLYAWVLGIEYFVFGPNVLLAKLVQSFLDSLACLLIYTIGLKLLNRRIALIAAVLYATYPLAIVINIRLYYQTLLNLALCWIILCVAAPVTIRNGMWTGIAVAISALAKPVTLPLAVILPLIRVLEGIRSGDTRTSSVLWPIYFAMACGLTLAPWTIRNYIIFHRLIPVQGGAESVLIQGSKEEYVDLDVISLRRKYKDFGARPGELTSTALSNHLTHLTSDPFDYSRFLGRKFLLSWYNTEGKEKNRIVLLVQLPFLVCALFGLVSSLPFWLKRPNWYILFLILYNCGVQVFLFPLVRYSLAIMPLVMLLAACGISNILKIYHDARCRTRTFY